MDQPVVRAGTTVHLPVAVPGALLYVGDIHARQGDGELSGVGLEIAATVTLRVVLLPGRAPSWPWALWEDRMAVMTADEDFTVARREACEALVTALERSFGMEPAEAMALLSVCGDMRMGQTMGRGPMTLRLEVPRFPGLEPA
jgi:acetamidase/formamidase